MLHIRTSLNRKLWIKLAQILSIHLWIFFAKFVIFDYFEYILSILELTLCLLSPFFKSILKIILCWLYWITQINFCIFIFPKEVNVDSNNFLAIFTLKFYLRSAITGGQLKFSRKIKKLVKVNYGAILLDFMGF